MELKGWSKFAYTVVKKCIDPKVTFDSFQVNFSDDIPVTYFQLYPALSVNVR